MATTPDTTAPACDCDHGTPRRYRRRVCHTPCRCVTCKAANAATQRRYRTRYPRYAPLRSHSDVDEVKVQRIVSGAHRYHWTETTIGERQEAVRILHRRRHSDGQIAALTGITARTVLRIRTRLNLPALPEHVCAPKRKDQAA